MWLFLPELFGLLRYNFLEYHLRHSFLNDLVWLAVRFDPFLNGLPRQDYRHPVVDKADLFTRINIFKSTLVAMGYPEYFRFRFSPEDMFFGIEPCGIDDEGAKRLPDEITREH